MKNFVTFLLFLECLGDKCSKFNEESETWHEIESITVAQGQKFNQTMCIALFNDKQYQYGFGF